MTLIGICAQSFAEEMMVSDVMFAWFLIMNDTDSNPNMVSFGQLRDVWRRLGPTHVRSVNEPGIAWNKENIDDELWSDLQTFGDWTKLM
jgi:hypothetical protein